MKCGTSSLHNYLDIHPDISMSQIKELNFFSHDVLWAKGSDWYSQHFSSPAKIRGEASPSYTRFPEFPDVPRRMSTLIPSAKLIYLVRDPVDRIVSHYMHSRGIGLERYSIEDALRHLDGNKYVVLSLYHLQLSRYLEYFPAEQILVVCTEDMKSDRRATLRTIFRFLGVDESFWSPQHELLYHVSTRKGRLRRALERSRVARQVRPHVPRSVISWLATQDNRKQTVDRPTIRDPLRSELRDYLRNDIERLRQELGRDFPKWTV
jgi:Sulfotransferase domain